MQPFKCPICDHGISRTEAKRFRRGRQRVTATCPHCGGQLTFASRPWRLIQIARPTLVASLVLLVLFNNRQALSAVFAAATFVVIIALLAGLLRHRLVAATPRATSDGS